ncbi:hypothetical protein D3C78_1764980 [compost metagenome]
MAVLIVGSTFLIVGQDLVGFLDLFKLAFGVFFLITIRVILHRQALIRLFDFALVCRLGNAEHLVIISLRHYFSYP